MAARGDLMSEMNVVKNEKEKQEPSQQGIPVDFA